MAKGNLFQGMARGKVGDVVLSRLDGQQVSRVRNRNPKNPKTMKQCVQRAIAANIQRLYSLGYDILDHSFEGKIVGRGNQRAFAKANMKILRNLIVDELNNNTAPESCVGRVGLPGIPAGVPFAGMQVSSGKLVQNAFRLSNGSNAFFEPTLPDTGGSAMTVPQWLASVGAKADDIFTFVCFRVPTATGSIVARVSGTPLSDSYADLYQTIFTYAQLKVKESAMTSTDTLATATLDDIFDIVGVNIDGTNELTEGIPVIDISMAGEAGDACYVACIMSRENEGVRSTETLELTGTAAFGVTADHIYDGWVGGSAIDGTDLILEGENF